MLMFSILFCVVAFLSKPSGCWPEVVEAYISDFKVYPCRNSRQSNTTTETEVIGLWVKSLTAGGKGIMVHPTAPTINFGALSLAQSSVDPSIFNSTATAQYVTYRGYFWVAFVFRRVSPFTSISNCILDKVVYDLIPTTSSQEVTSNLALSDLFGQLGHDYVYINNPLDVQISNTLFSSVRFSQIISSGRTILTRAIFKQPLTDSDWSDLKFIRALRYGLNQTIIDILNLDAPSPANLVYINSTVLTKPQIAANRHVNFNKFGFNMYEGSFFIVVRERGPNPGSMSVIHIYGATKLLLTAGAKVRFSHQATIMSGNNIVAEAVAEVELSNNGSGGLVIQLLNVVWKFYMTTGTNPYVATNQASAQIGTLTAAMVTRYMKVVIMISFQYSGNGGSEPDIFSGLGWTWVSVMADVAETEQQNVVQRSSAWVKSTFNIASTDYLNIYFGMDQMITETDYKSSNPTGEDYNITIFNQDQFAGFPDWETLLPGFNYNASYTGNCYRQMPLAYMDADLSCKDFRHWFTKSTVPGVCPFKWVSYYEPCVHCNTGYYPDVSEYRPPNENPCKSKSECVALDSGFVYVNPNEGSLYDFRGMCLSCPPNCKTCDVNLNCIECVSPMMNTSDPLCECRVLGCNTCLTTVCDLCPLSSYLHYDNRTQIRTCQWISCKPTFGLNTSYVYGGASGMFSLMCVRCYHQNCTNCGNNYMVCNNYCPGGSSLVDYNFALAPDYSPSTSCTPITTEISGYVYDPATTYFTLCIANCTKCLPTNSSQCEKCVGDTIYLVDNKSCTTLSLCPNGTYPQANNAFRCWNCIADCTYCIDGSHECKICASGMIFHADQTKCVALSGCVAGSGSFVSNGVCKSCLAGCSECSDKVSCIKCFETMYMSANMSSCMNSCPEGEKPLPGSYWCKPCVVDKCRSCLDGPNVCAECNPDYSLEQGSCSPCAAPKYLDIDSKCQDCRIDKCERCANTSMTCESCETGYILEGRRCIPANYGVRLAYFDKSTSTITMSFEYQLFPDEYLDYLSLSLTDADGNSVDGKIENVLVDNGKLLIRISSKTSFNGGVAEIGITHPERFLSIEKPGFSLSNDSSLVIVPRVTMNYLRSTDAYTAAIYGGKPVLSLLMIVMFIIAQSYAVILIKVYQMMEFMQLYNQVYPENFENFISVFQATNPIDFTLKEFSGIYAQISCPNMDIKLLEKGFDCQFFSNATPSLNVIMFWILLILIFKLGSSLIRFINVRVSDHQNQQGLTTLNAEKQKSSVQEKAFITKDSSSRPMRLKDRVIKHVFEISDALCSLKAVYFLAQLLDMDIMVAVALNLGYYSGDSDRNYLAIVNRLVSATVLVGFPLLILIFIFCIQSALKDPKGPYSYFLAGRRQRYGYQIYREVIYMFRNFVACLLVIWLYNKPYHQITFMIIMTLSFTCVDIYYKPYENNLENRVVAILGVLYTISSCVFLLARSMEFRTTRSTRNNYFGYPLIVLFSAIIATNSYPSVYSLYIWSKKKLQGLRLRNKLKNPSADKMVSESPAHSETNPTSTKSQITNPKTLKKRKFTTIAASLEITDTDIYPEKQSTGKHSTGKQSTGMQSTKGQTVDTKPTYSRFFDRLSDRDSTLIGLSENVVRPALKFFPKRLKRPKKGLPYVRQEANQESERAQIGVNPSRTLIE